VINVLSASVIQTLHHPNLLLRQPVQLIHQRVNLPVGGLDLPLVELLVSGDDGGQPAACLAYRSVVSAPQLANQASLVRDMRRVLRGSVLGCHSFPNSQRFQPALDPARQSF